MAKTKNNIPKVRSRVAREAWGQTGAGSHGGSAKTNNRRDRQAMKQELKLEECGECGLPGGTHDKSCYHEWRKLYER